MQSILSQKYLVYDEIKRLFSKEGFVRKILHNTRGSWILLRLYYNNRSITFCKSNLTFASKGWDLTADFYLVDIMVLYYNPQETILKKKFIKDFAPFVFWSVLMSYPQKAQIKILIRYLSLSPKMSKWTFLKNLGRMML